jgi:hypothetical protein
MLMDSYAGQDDDHQEDGLMSGITAREAGKYLLAYRKNPGTQIPADLIQKLEGLSKQGSIYAANLLHGLGQVVEKCGDVEYIPEPARFLYTRHGEKGEIIAEPDADHGIHNSHPSYGQEVVAADPAIPAEVAELAETAEHPHAEPGLIEIYVL